MRLTNRFARGSSTRTARLRASASAGGLAVAVASLFVIATPGPAGAASLPGNLQKFANCPIDNPAVTTCLYSTTTSTTFEIGSTTVTSTSPTTLQMGVISTPTEEVAVLPDNGTQALQSPALPLPGGLLGIPGAPDGGALAVTATPQIVGLPVLNLLKLVEGKGTGLTLPMDVLVGSSTGLLGSDCTIADAADPITLKLTTGTTSPPPPNTSIKGVVGKVRSTDEGLLKVRGMSLVGNSFAVPGAENCGTDGILDEILDLDKSLPSAAGSNTAILSGNSFTAPASLIRQYLG
jgi:hypothetical protein